MPDSALVYQALGLILLILLSGFFSGSETAYLSVNRIRIFRLAEEGDKRAIRLKYLIEHPNRVLATILVGNNLVNILAAAIATSMAINMFGNQGIGIATGIMTLLILVFGEITPKSFANKHSEKISLSLSTIILLLCKLLFPVVRFLTYFTNIFVRTMGADIKVSPYITEEDIMHMVDVSEKEGVIEKEEKEMIQGIFEFGDTTVKEIMVPRIDIQRISVDSSFDDAIKEIQDSGHSRIPVYEQNIDNIVGILYAKDILNYYKTKKKVVLKEVLRDAYFVPETKKLDEILREFQVKKVQIAIVLDEYGGTQGIVTLEDVLEELVGEIMDEYDVEEYPIQEIDEKSVIADARMTISDINDFLETNLPEDEIDTLGGLIYDKLGKVPELREEVMIDGITLIVEKMRGNKIRRVKVIKE